MSPGALLPPIAAPFRHAVKSRLVHLLNGAIPLDDGDRTEHAGRRQTRTKGLHIRRHPRRGGVCSSPAALHQVQAISGATARLDAKGEERGGSGVALSECRIITAKGAASLGVVGVGDPAAWSARSIRIAGTRRDHRDEAMPISRRDALETLWRRFRAAQVYGRGTVCVQHLGRGTPLGARGPTIGQD